MKICVCSTGSDLDSQISPAFGRSLYFLVVDLKTDKIKALPNPGFQARRGAGIAASQTIVSHGAEAIICGNIGPNAFSILQMSGIKVYSGVFGLSVKEVINKYKKGELKEAKTPTTGGRFGFGPQRRGFRRRER